ncbi:MAG TPA: hypothetical protein VGM56_32575 [Byssovorax sp.]
MLAKARLALALALAALAAASCEAPPRARDVALLASPEATLARRLAARACAAVAGCCASRRLGPFDGDACEALAEETIESVARLRRERGGGAIDPARSAACEAKIERYRATCVDPELPMRVLAESPCDELFTAGPAARGGSRCDVSAECARGPGVLRAYCNRDTHVCEELTAAGAGAACVGDCDDDDCGEVKYAGAPLAYCDARDGLACDAKTKTCAARPRIGEACGEARPCEARAFCDRGTCAARATAGASCARGATVCAPAFLCDPGSKTCVSRAKDGDACSDDDDCASHDCAGRVCHAANDATMLRLTGDLRLFCPAE